MKIKFFQIFLCCNLLFVTIGFFVGCFKKPTENSATETTNGDIYGFIYSDSGVAAKNTIVHLRSSRFVSLTDGLSKKAFINDSFSDSTFTDKEGKFRFNVNVSDSGELVVGTVVGGFGLRKSFVKQPNKPHNLGDLMMDSTGILRGTVQDIKGNSPPILIQVLGTEKTLLLDSAQRVFEIRDLPADTYSIKITVLTEDSSLLESTASINPGQLLSDIIIDLRIPILIVDGINYHNGPLITARLVQFLEYSGLFKVSVSTTPPDSAAPGWDIWRPKFSDFKAVIINYSSGVWDNYTDHPWPKEVETAFEDFLSGGGGAVITHSTFNAFGNWDQFMVMTGLAWREKEKWPGLYIDSMGIQTTIPLNQGLNPYAIDTTATIVNYNKQHPINQGLPNSWLHFQDEIDFGLRGPANNITLLNYSYNSHSSQNEPIDWTVNYGQGRVYANSLGHVWNADSSMWCIGFQTLMIRGTEWAANGLVTYPVPANFPTDSTTSLADP